MKKSKEEKELIKSIERDEWIPVADSREITIRLKQAAGNTILKDQRMNIRISKRDLLSLKAKALEEGMPYQALVASILHKYISGALTEKKDI